MNYARISNRPFITRKVISTKRKVSGEAQSRRNFIASHSFSVMIDPITKQGTVKVTKANGQKNKRCTI